MTWKSQRGALSSSLQTTLNWEEQLVHSKTGPLEHKLKEWADQHIMKYKTDKCKVLQLGRPSFWKDFLPQEGRTHVFPSQQHNSVVLLTTIQAAAWLSGEQLCWKGPGNLVDSKLYVSQKCALAAKELSAPCINSCSINRSIASRLRQAIIPLYLALIRSHWEYPVQVWFPQYKKNTNLEWAQQRAIKKVRAWSMCSIKRGWGNWACLAWQREGLGGLIWHNSSFPVPPSRLLRAFSHVAHAL